MSLSPENISFNLIILTSYLVVYLFGYYKGSYTTLTTMDDTSVEPMKNEIEYLRGLVDTLLERADD